MKVPFASAPPSCASAPRSSARARHRQRRRPAFPLQITGDVREETAKPSDGGMIAVLAMPESVDLQLLQIGIRLRKIEIEALREKIREAARQQRRHVTVLHDQRRHR